MSNAASTNFHVMLQTVLEKTFQKYQFVICDYDSIVGILTEKFRNLDTSVSENDLSLMVEKNITELFAGNEYRDLVIFSLMEYYFSNIQNREDAILALGLFSKNLEQFSYSLDQDDCILLFQSYPNFSFTLKEISLECEELIQDDLFDSRLFGLILSSYMDFCKIEEKEELFMDSSYNEENYAIYLRDISRIPLLTSEEERMLDAKILAGDDSARLELVTYNLRHVISIAKKYLNRGLDFADLIQVGNEGLITASKNYDPMNGNFYAYSSKVITSNILRHLCSDNTFSNFVISERMWLNMTKYFRAVNQLLLLYNEAPAEKIAEVMGISVCKVRQIERTILLRNRALNKSISEDDEEEIHFAEIIGENDQQMEDFTGVLSLQQEVMKYFNEAQLTENQRIVLEYRFGLNGKPILTQPEIGKILHLTASRVQQLEEEALHSLRNPHAFNQELVGYLDYPEQAIERANLMYQEEEARRASIREQKRLQDRMKKNNDCSISTGKSIKGLYPIVGIESDFEYEYIYDRLNYEEQFLVLLGYGDDVQNPVRSDEFDTSDRNALYNRLIPKMKKLSRAYRASL